MRRFLRMQEEHLSIAVVAKIILRKLKREPKPHLTIEALRTHAAHTKARLRLYSMSARWALVARRRCRE